MLGGAFMPRLASDAFAREGEEREFVMLRLCSGAKFTMN
jgi:hypothetical protein